MTAQQSTRYDVELALSPILDRQSLVDDIARLEAETRVLENIDQLEHSAAAVHPNERAHHSSAAAIRSNEERPNECTNHATVASLTLQNFVHPLPLLRINGGASSNERQGWRRYIFDDVGCFRWQLFVLVGVVLLGGIIGGLFAQFNKKDVDCVRCSGSQGDGLHHETESGELSLEKSKDNQKTPLTNGEGANPFKDSNNTIIVVVLLVLGCAFLCFWLNVSRFCPPMSPGEMFEDIAVDPRGTEDGETDGGTDGQDGPREDAPVSSAGLRSSIAPESSLSSLYISHSPQTRVLP
jgi:hypothetical protein